MSTFFTMGDLAQFRMLTGHGRRLRSEMAELSTEATTGLVADKTERLNGNYVQVAGIESRLSQIAAFRTVTSEQQILATGMQTAISSVTSQSNALGSSFLAAVSSQNDLRIDSLANDAAATLKSMLSALNTRIGERSLFSGQATSSLTFGSSEDLLDALQASVAASGAVSANDVEAAVNAWFDDPSGFEATSYGGGAVAGPVQIAPDEVAQVDVTGMDPALVKTIKGAAMGALLSRGVLAGSTVARSSLMQKAAETLVGGQTDLAALSSRLGTTEASMQNAATRNDAEKDALETARLNLLSVDQYDIAARYKEAQGQLEALYTLTSRASQLSLVDYIR